MDEEDGVIIARAKREGKSARRTDSDESDIRYENFALSSLSYAGTIGRKILP